MILHYKTSSFSIVKHSLFGSERKSPLFSCCLTVGVMFSVNPKFARQEERQLDLLRMLQIKLQLFLEEHCSGKDLATLT